MDQRKLDLQQEINEGSRARELIEGLLPYFQIMEYNLLEGFKQCSATDVDTLTGIKLQFHALNSLKANIESVITTGRLAEAELEGKNNG